MSAFQANLSEVQAVCQRDNGASLATVRNGDVQHGLAAHVKAVAAEGWPHWQDLEYFWVGAEFDVPKWHWTETGLPVEDSYTNWELKQSTHENVTI